MAPATKEVQDHETSQNIEVMATSLGRTDQGYRCIYCQKIYSRKYGLKIHLRTHTGFKPLKCRICSRAFSDPSNLNKHTRLHAEQTAVRCHICGKGAARGRDLERHVLSRHPEIAKKFQTQVPDLCQELVRPRIPNPFLATPTPLKLEILTEPVGKCSPGSGTLDADPVSTGKSYENPGKSCSPGMVQSDILSTDSPAARTDTDTQTDRDIRTADCDDDIDIVSI